MAGTPTTQGLKALAEAYPSRDAPIVERMKAAGAIPIGRTNLPSGAVRWHTDSELWGATGAPRCGPTSRSRCGRVPAGRRLVCGISTRNGRISPPKSCRC